MKYIIGPIVAIGGIYLVRRLLVNAYSDSLVSAARRVVAAEPSVRFPCSVFTAKTLNVLQARTDRGIGSKWWQDMNIWDRSRPFSPIEANPSGFPFYPESGDFTPGRWYLCQSWRSLTGPNRTIGPNDRGHSWFWHAMTDRTGHVLDSDENRGPRYGGAVFSATSTDTGSIVAWSDRQALYPGGIACTEVA